MNRNKKGFSFVGVVIAFAISTMIYIMAVNILSPFIPKTKEKQEAFSAIKSEAMLNKNYIAFNRAFSKIKLANGSSYKGLCNSNDCNKELFKKHLTITKECSVKTFRQCWHKAYNEFSGVILRDGTLVAYSSSNKECKNNLCGIISIDTNGFKQPNKLGYDIFEFKITPNILIK